MMSQFSDAETIRLYRFNTETNSFDEIPPESIPEGGIKDLFLAEGHETSYALIWIDKYIVFLFHGQDTSVSVKFKSAHEITKLRDKILLGGKVVTVDEGSEPIPFKFLTKMADPKDYGVEDGQAVYAPAYSGSEADVDKFEKLSLEKISLLLDQVPTPDGFVREAVIHENNLYAIKHARQRFMGSEIEEIELVPLPKGSSIESGAYMAADLTPRLLFENGHLVFVELLRKTAQRQKQETLFDHLA
jgi:hypothetical protein